MISVRQGLWETNSSSMHVLTIGTNSKYDLPVPEKLVIRYTMFPHEDVIDNDVQSRLNVVVKLIMSSDVCQQGLYRLMHFIDYIKTKGVRVDTDWDSFCLYSIGWCDTCETIFKKKDPYDILWKYITNSRGLFTVDIWDHEESRLQKIKDDRDMQVIIMSRE